MPIYKPSELLAFLHELGIHPKRSLSQNFLIDGNIIKKIASVACLAKGDLVIEIGPGPGCLTEELLNQGASVIAIEKDTVLAAALRRLQTPDQRLNVFCEDIMDFPLEQWKHVKVIANLPYHLTTPIITKLITKRENISLMILMVQEEVARRFTAKPKTSDYSSFTVFLNFYCRPRYAFPVRRKCFYPSPTVDSAVVVLEPKQPPDVDAKSFFRLTRTAFEHRRKMLRSSLRRFYTAETVTTVLEAIGIDPRARPEELSLDDFLKLYVQLQTYTVT